MSQVKVVKVDAENTEWNVIKLIAEVLEIEPFGKSREELSWLINEKIDALGEEAVNELNAKLEAAQPAGENVKETPNDEQTEEETVAEETPANKKWYEDGYGNQPGDRVIIIGKTIHEGTDKEEVILQGRLAVVVGPARKNDTIKINLINQQDGTIRTSDITLKFGEYANEGTIQVEKPARKPRKKAEKVETNNEPTVVQPANWEENNEQNEGNEQQQAS